MLDRTLIEPFLRTPPHRLLFVTVSGAHLYGFESADSDYDLRGAHIARVRDVVGLDTPNETYEVMDRSGPVEMDIVTHDVRKFFGLLLKRNGYVLEQIFSPLVIVGGPQFEELRDIAGLCITRHHRYHYSSFAANQWETVIKSGEPTVKGLLYTYRVLLAGIHLMRTGRVEANLRTLNDEFDLAYIRELIERKAGGTEKGELPEAELDRHRCEYARLSELLELESSRSTLPDQPTGRAALNDLLVRVRMATA